MRIFHLLPGNSPLIVGNYITFVKEECETIHHTHVFACISSGQSLPSEVMSVGLQPLSYEQTFNEMKKAEKTILHSLFFSYRIDLFLLKNPRILKRVFVLAWGGDIYVDSKVYKGIKPQIAWLIRKAFLRNVRHFIGLFPPDIDYYRKRYNRKVKSFWAIYSDAVRNPIYNRANIVYDETENNPSVDPVKILVGHSSVSSLNHIFILENIQAYKDNNIRVILPLSYGNSEYGDQVERKAKECLGSKAVALRQLIPFEEYINMLDTVDVAIFHTYRQIALGNIYPLMYLGKKLYMPRGSVMYEYFTSVGIEIGDSNKIGKMDYNELIKPISAKAGYDYVKKYIADLDWVKSQWEIVFDYC